MTAHPNPWLKQYLAAAFALILGGCVTSLQPLFTDKDLIFDPALIGIWEEKEDSTWCFEKAERNDPKGSKAYTLLVTQKEVTSPLCASLGKIGRHRFLDLSPDGSELKERKFGELYQAALIPGHLILRISHAEPTLEIAFMDHSWLEKLVAENPKVIRHEVVDGRIILTAPTEDLQQFLLKYADKEEAWEKPTTLNRKQPKGLSSSRGNAARSHSLNPIVRHSPRI